MRPPRSQEYARSVRLLSGGWCAKENRFLGSPQLTLRWHGQGDGNATRGTTETKLGWLAELRQAVERLREAEALPADPC